MPECTRYSESYTTLERIGPLTAQIVALLYYSRNKTLMKLKNLYQMNLLILPILCFSESAHGTKIPKIKPLHIRMQLPYLRTTGLPFLPAELNVPGNGPAMAS